MRRTLGFLALGGMVAVAVAQVNGASLLEAVSKAFHGADAVKATYTVQVIGSSAEPYSVSLKKPNMARIETPTQTIVADGTDLVTYDKAEKTYFKKPQTEDDLKALFATDELNLFAGFFNTKAYAAASSKSLGTKNRKGENVTALQANVDAAGKRVVTYYVAGDNLPRAAQIDLNDPNGKVQMIVDTKTFEVNGDAAATLFAFNAPAGSRQITLEEMNSAKWYTNLHEAVDAASKSGRKIFVDFYATWCGPCKKLEKEVLNTDEFKKLSSKLVFLRIDVDQQPSTAKKFNIEAMPTQMILNKDGSVLTTKVGYGSPSDFYSWLRTGL